jgi:flagellar basal-body rod protein FlgB
MLRQSLLTNNLANVNTPGYQRQDVNFQSTLASALQNGQSPDAVSFSPYTQQQSVRGDGNGVSADQESANLAENGILFQDVTEIAASREQIMLAAMGMRG